VIFDDQRFTQVVTRGDGVVKTLAIRLDDDLHAQLSVIAQLSELTITDAIRQSIEAWVEAKRSLPEVTARAQSVLDDIERDAAQRRSAIATLFGGSSDGSPATEPPEGETPQRRTRGKGGESATS
jgi:predicted transcriptional regulator